VFGENYHLDQDPFLECDGFLLTLENMIPEALKKFNYRHLKLYDVTCLSDDVDKNM
jgi:hypothetical protein